MLRSWAPPPIFHYFSSFISAFSVTRSPLVPSRTAQTATKPPDKSPDGSPDYSAVRYCHGLPRLLNSLLPILSSRSVSVRDSGPFRPSLMYLSMDCSCVFQRLPYNSICLHLALWPSIAFSCFLVVSTHTCISTVLRSIEQLS